MLDLLTDPHAWAALVTLSALEIVLGIDNVVFISVLVSRLPEPQATQARRLGLSMALVFRILLLLTLTWLVGTTCTPVSPAQSAASTPGPPPLVMIASRWPQGR